ncbi:MAG: hypothetical protein ACP5VR_13520 [Acidimicrobiales bacterium]
MGDHEAQVHPGAQSPGRHYGSPRVTGDLHEAGVAVSEGTVAGSIAAPGIVRVSPRLFKLATQPEPGAPYPPDLFNRGFPPMPSTSCSTRT